MAQNEMAELVGNQKAVFRVTVMKRVIGFRRHEKPVLLRDGTGYFTRNSFRFDDVEVNSDPPETVLEEIHHIDGMLPYV